MPKLEAFQTLGIYNGRGTTRENVDGTGKSSGQYEYDATDGIVRVTFEDDVVVNIQS